jgi:fucose permease
MAVQALGSFVNFEESQIRDSTSARQKDAPTPSNYELDGLSWGTRYTGPITSPPPAATVKTPRTPEIGTPPNEENISRPQTPRPQAAVEITQSLSNPPMNRWRFLIACIQCACNGINDSAAGALIPYMETDYSIGYAIVSLIFIANAIGFIGAAPFTHALQARFGRAKVLVFAEILLVTGYTMVVIRPPFPVVVVGFLFTGLGMATILALNNVFCANLTNATTTLGIFHGSYGIGGIVGPLMATGLVSTGHRWSTFYAIPLGLASFNAVFAYWAFRNYETELSASLLPHGSRGQSPVRAKSPLKEAVRNKTTLLGALFIFAYQGAEVSISGWVISFLLAYRAPALSDRASVGYVTSGFWAGIALGRFLLSQPCQKLGEKISVFLLVLGATAFQLLVWLIPNIIGEAVAVVIVGLLLGPIWPCAIVIFSRLIGRKIQMSSLSFIAALGSSGGAFAPFMTGLIAQKAGTWVLHPICVGLFGVMAISWGCLDRVGKRRE